MSRPDLRSVSCFQQQACNMDTACPWLSECKQDAIMGPTEPERTPNGQWEYPEPDPQSGLMFDRKAIILPIPQELIDDAGSVDYGDIVEGLMSGRLTSAPLVPMPRHRCPVCWMVSLLPRHHRCGHGRLVCEECETQAAGW